MSVTKSDVELFERLVAQLQELRSEMAMLSKSKPDNAVNKFKLGHINEVLGDANSLLVEEHKPLRAFTVFNEDDVPTNSDVVFILAQYLVALEGWRSTNVIPFGYNWVWDIEGPERLSASPPTRTKQNRDHL